MLHVIDLNFTRAPAVMPRHSIVHLRPDRPGHRPQPRAIAQAGTDEEINSVTGRRAVDQPRIVLERSSQAVELITLTIGFFLIRCLGQGALSLLIFPK